MNNEIKKILDYFENYVNDKYETYTVVSRHAQNLKILLDYITNLQEELALIVKDDERSQATIIRQAKEIQRLKEERKELYRYTPEDGFRKVDEDE